MSELDGLLAATKQSPNIKRLEISAGAVSHIPQILHDIFGPKPAFLFADEKSWAAAGPQIIAALNQADIAYQRHIEKASPKPKPSVELSQKFAAMIAQNDCIAVAIGSGVMNDVVKHASFSLERDYLCVATAVSMDGYTSAGAPLSEKGFKKTIQCKPARAIIADLDILAAAPAQMTSWGYSDLAGKIPAGADWILADAVGVEKIDPESFAMVQHHLRQWLSNPEAVASGELQAMQNLFVGLSMVGFAMERHGSSRPASGADHQIAHLWEMEDHQYQGEYVSHGACVAVGSLASLALHHYFLSQDISKLDVQAIIQAAPDMDATIADIHAQLGDGEIALRAIEETRAKDLSQSQHEERLLAIAQGFADIKKKMQSHLPSLVEFRSDLAKAGAPAKASDIGIDAKKLSQTIYNARFIRSRYTILDVLDETGLLKPAIAAIVPAIV